MEHFLTPTALILTVFVRVSSQMETSYARDKSLDDKKCVGDDVEFETDLRVDSSIQCAALCEQNPGCKGVFHRRSPTAKCIGCKKISTATEGLGSENGTKYYLPHVVAKYQEECTARVQCLLQSNQSCEDTLNVCVCTPGYSFNPTSGTCILTQECEAYGNSYQKHPLKFISNNNENVFPATLETCEYSCTTATAYTCLTFDFSYNTSTCCLQSVTALTVPEAFVFRPLEANDHYSRNCF